MNFDNFLEFFQNILIKTGNIEIHGLELVVRTVLVDWFLLILTKMIWSIYVNFKVKEYKNLQKKLKSCEEKEDIKSAIKIRRKIKEIENNPKKRIGEPSFIWNFLRILIPMFIFRNCWLCETNINFWKPFTFLLSFPHNVNQNKNDNDNETIVKIGFIYLWLNLQKIDRRIVDYLYPLKLTYSYNKVPLWKSVLNKILK